MGQTVPSELVFASFGEAGNEIEEMPTFLELYRKGTQDDCALPNIKSPVPRMSQEVALVDVEGLPVAKPKRRPTLRKSRSMGDFFDYIVVEKPVPTITSASSITETMQSMLSPTVPIEKAKEAIIDSDAQRMAEFRVGFRSNRPVELKLAPFPPPSGPLPSPPLPTALLAIQSPRAPYWVKPILAPRTPRTIRTERRQGWGGEWVSLGEMVVQLKQL